MAASNALRFRVDAGSGDARAGVLETPHGPAQTPAFMVVGTGGAVRGLAPDQLRGAGTEIVLANTYHLAVRPGEAIVAKLGGLHGFTRWDGPMLTDSGGFQVFSLPKKQISDEGVRFRNDVNGSEMNLTPERSIQIQNELGADIIMVLDECTPYPADHKLAASGVKRTLDWAKRSAKAHGRPKDQALFGIVQGGTHLDLRGRCAESLVAMDFEGYAIGGVSVGEGFELMNRIVTHTAPLLPQDKPRYAMGVGLPEDILACIGNGIDLFDCVIPTRFGRAATVFTVRGKIRLTNRRFRRDAYPIDLSCDCSTCSAGFSRAYLHHLFAANEILGAVLCSIHNVRFYQRLVQGARDAILAGRYDAYRQEFLKEFGATPQSENARD